jgi:hypothetical protein
MAWYDVRHWTWSGAAPLVLALILILLIGLLTDAVQAAPDLVRDAFVIGAIMFVVPSSAVYGPWGKIFLGARLALLFGSIAWAVAYVLGLI